MRAKNSRHRCHSSLDQPMTSVLLDLVITVYGKPDFSNLRRYGYTRYMTSATTTVIPLDLLVQSYSNLQSALVEILFFAKEFDAIKGKKFQVATIFILQGIGFLGGVFIT